MGLPPVLISLMMSVFKPMAAIAITIKNLLNVFKGSKTAAETPIPVRMVVIMDAKRKYRINLGKDLPMPAVLPVVLFFRAS